jgi:hypothetical protein
VCVCVCVSPFARSHHRPCESTVQKCSLLPPEETRDAPPAGATPKLPAALLLHAVSALGPLLGCACFAWAGDDVAPGDFSLGDYANALLSAALAQAGSDLGVLLAQGATMAGGSIIGGAVAWQLATAQAKQRAEEQARAKTREALSALDPESLTSVLGELPSWLAYRDFERAGWLNRVLVKAWPYLDQATSGVIVAALAPILEATRPTFLTSLRFERFSFGSIPARIEGVKVYDVDGEDAVEIDLEVFWKGDPDVVLGVRAAQDAVRVPVSLTEVQVSGTVRLTFGPLLPKFPCFGAISVSLMGKPTLAFDLRVVGSDITLVPGVAQALRSYFKGLLAAYLVWPRRITVAIPGTGYKITDEDRSAGTLHVRLLGATGALAASSDTTAAADSAGDADGAQLPVSSRLRLGSDAVFQVRYFSAPVAANTGDSDAVAAATAAAVLVRTAPPQVVRPGGALTLAVDDPTLQGVWIGVFDRTVETKASGGSSSGTQALGDLALGSGAALVGEVFIPIALCADQREGDTVQCSAELSAPGVSGMSSGAAAGGGGAGSSASLAAVGRRGGMGGWASSLGGAAWDTVARGAGAVASTTVTVTRGVGGAWGESMRTLQKDGWGGVTSVPRAIATGYMHSAPGDGAPKASGQDMPPRGVAGAQKVGPAWVVWGASGGTPAVQVLAPLLASPDGASPAQQGVLGSLLLELRYETGASAGSSPMVQTTSALAPLSSSQSTRSASLRNGGSSSGSAAAAPPAAVTAMPVNTRPVDTALDDDEEPDLEWPSPKHEAATPGSGAAPQAHTQQAGSARASPADKLRRLRLAAGAAALALSSPDSGGPADDRAKLAALLEQAERLVNAAEGGDTRS